MKTMRMMQKFLLFLSVLGVLGIAAVPLAEVWNRQAEDVNVDVFGHPKHGLDIVNGLCPIVVDLRDDVTEADVANINRQYGLHLRPNSIEYAADKVMVGGVEGSTDAVALMATLRADSRVEAAEVEQTYSIPEYGKEKWVVRATNSTSGADASDESGTRPNDPRYNEQWNFAMVKAEEAWTRTKGKGAIVAVIDTGVSGKDSPKGKRCRDFGDTKFVAGYDFVGKTPDAYDDHGHGTHVAGTIAESTNNNEGVAGLAYQATIMPLKVLSAQGSGSAADIADAIRFAADKGANVINMSLGSPYPSDVIRNACKYARKKGVVIVCAAGNGFGEPVGYPAAFPECIAVSSVGASGNLAFYSSYGKEVALAAPGGDMQEGGEAGGILQNTIYPESQGGRGDDYYHFQGTSMASPHVAAVAALLVSQNIKDPAKVRDILVKSATPKDDPLKYGAGILSAGGATEIAAQAGGFRLRYVFIVGMGLMLLLVGGPRRSLPLRGLMAVALGVGMFAPDWFASAVGADSAWNLLGYSLVVPLALTLLLDRGRGVKVAAAFSLGVGLCLWAGMYNNDLPFTYATFGEAAHPWVAVNMVGSLVIALIGGATALRGARMTARTTGNEISDWV